MQTLKAPLTDEVIHNLKMGDEVLLVGTIYVARDAAHKRMIEALARGEELPADLNGQIIYYAGPCPAPPGKPIGSAGPTTSGRMDAYAPTLIEKGLKGMVGKGLRNQGVIDAMKKYGAIYFATPGGAGVYLANRIKKAEVIAYEDLGAEALFKLEVEDFPCVVCIDAEGNDLYENR